MCVCLFFEEKDTRKDGRLQYVVKEESSLLQRQQDFGQNIVISKHVRTQTDSCNFVVYSLPFADLYICIYMLWMACIQWDRGSGESKIPSLKFPNR